MIQSLYGEITVRREEFVSVRRSPEACAYGLALALPQEVWVPRCLGVAGVGKIRRWRARPGVGSVLATYEVPIEGRDEWVAAARRLA